MRLSRLEIRNYRSIQEQVEDGVETAGLTCLVGKNNTGKSNLLQAIRFLIDGGSVDEHMYYMHDSSNEIDVRGYFNVEEEDFERLKIKNKREAVRRQTLDDGTLGVCRRSSNGDLEVIDLYPREERLRPGVLVDARDEAWKSKDNGSDFRAAMEALYPELIPYLEEGKESNKSEWKYAYDRMLEEQPEAIEFVAQPGPAKTGISADLLNLLPRTLLIPAVKEVGDATRTSSRAEFGSLLKAVSSEIEEELNRAIEDAFTEVHRQLNIVEDPETGDLIDERHTSVSSLERQLTKYVQETFSDHSIDLQFPNPETSMVFNNAQVWVQEEGYGRVPVADVGEGVKRILIFSLIRTLADMRSGRFGIEEDGEDDHTLQPLLLLYEEAELFLHPGLQQVLLNTFRDFVSAGDQVVYSTHSPFIIPQERGSTVNLVRKSTGEGTGVTEIWGTVDEREPRVRTRLLALHSLSAFIFADRVVLVEGESDRIILTKNAKRLSEKWRFKDAGIPIMDVAGRDNLPIFRSFLTSIGIEPFTVTDLDAVAQGINRFDLPQAIETTRQQLVQRSAEIADEDDEAVRVNRDLAEQIVDRAGWEGIFERVQDLLDCLTEEEGCHTEEQASALERLLALKEQSAIREALSSEDDEVSELRSRLQSELLEENVLLLVTDIEAYYPYGGGNKIGAALDYDEEVVSPEELRKLMVRLEDHDGYDMELFLQRVFA